MAFQALVSIRWPPPVACSIITLLVPQLFRFAHRDLIFYAFTCRLSSQRTWRGRGSTPVYLSTAWLCLCDSVSVPLILRAVPHRQFCQLYYDSDVIFEASGKGCDIRGLIKAWVWERLGLVDSQSHTETNQWNLLPYDTVPSCYRVQAQWPCKAR